MVKELIGSHAIRRFSQVIQRAADLLAITKHRKKEELELLTILSWWRDSDHEP